MTAPKQLNSRNNYYVDISRTRKNISIYVDSQKRATEQLGKFTDKLVADDFMTKKISADKIYSPERFCDLLKKN